MRVKITLSYDGSHFSGFQIQSDNTACKTVAGELTKAFKRLNITSHVQGSGRTDLGVHALRQVIHIDLPSFWSDLSKLRTRLNDFVRPHINIQIIEPINDTFHARFHAKSRLYRYVLYSGEYQPFLAHYAMHLPQSIDVSYLHQNIQLFQGKHNFEYFKKVGGGTTSPLRTIFKAGAYRYKQFIIIYFFGDAFLRSQVRMMVEMALQTCFGKYTQNDIMQQHQGERRASTMLAPACGLYLSRIYY